MKKGIKALALLLCGAMCLTAFTGCATEKKKTKVRVSEVTHSIFYAPQYAAINLGFFEEEGIELELSNAGGADKAMAAVLSGQIDIGFAGPEASIYVYNEGKEDYPQVFAQLTRRDGSFIVGREQDDDFDWSEMAGKTILPGRKGGVPYMTLCYVLKQKGLVPGEDILLDDSIQFDSMAGAFTGGSGDYVSLFEPTASALEKEGRGYIVSSVGQEAGEIPYTAYFAKQSYLKKNSDLVQRFTRAIYKGQQWVAEHSAEEIAETIEPSFPDTDLATLTSCVERYKSIGAWNTDPMLSQESFDRLQDVIMEAGELEEKAPYDKIVNNTYAEKAMQEK